MSTDNRTKGVVYNENSKGPRTEPWGMPNRSLQTSDKVDPIFIDWYLSVMFVCLKRTVTVETLQP